MLSFDSISLEQWTGFDSSICWFSSSILVFFVHELHSFTKSLTSEGESVKEPSFVKIDDIQYIVGKFFGNVFVELS